MICSNPSIGSSVNWPRVEPSYSPTESVRVLAWNGKPATPAPGPLFAERFAFWQRLRLDSLLQRDPIRGDPEGHMDDDVMEKTEL